MKRAVPEPSKRAPLSEVDWQIFRLGLFAVAALVMLLACGWLFGERGAHVDPESTRTSQLRQGS